MHSGSTTTVTQFGVLPDGRVVEMHSLTNASGMEVCFLNLGGIIIAVRVPDRDGTIADVTPGYDTLEEYLDDTHYFGALVGRYANRISDSHFVVDGCAYNIAPNEGPNLLHGGPNGFHRVLWNVEPFASPDRIGAVLTHLSPALVDGFPGNLMVRVTYSLTDHGELCFDYSATTDVATPINLTQHLYFNLAGHGVGDILGHELTLYASRYLPVDDELIPTGQVLPVDGTAFDFRSPRTIGEGVRAGADELRHAGYDHNFVLDGVRMGEAMLAARLREPRSGRVLEIETTEPGLQVYSGNQLGAERVGKEGRRYGQFSALALETQHFPDSPNVPLFPSTILRPGTEYRSRSVYRFGVS
ncbi:MAG: aldose epimerase family protein [Gemmatimonadota bacterium]